MKKQTFFLLIIAIVLLSIGLVLFVYGYYVIYNVEEREIRLEVGEGVGINTDSDTINFGKVPPNGGSQRTILLNHKYNKPLFVRIQVKGDVARFVALQENGFWIEPNETKEINVIATVPEGTKYGNYTGRLKAVLRRI